MPKEGRMAAPPQSLRPFPWRSLEVTTRGEVSALRDVKRWAAGHVRAERLVAAFAELLGAEVDVQIGRAQPVASSRSMADGVAVAIAPADLPEIDRGALIEVESALAANVVARALKRPSPALLSAGTPPAPALAGAFAAIVIATVRRAHTGIALRVVDAGPVRALEHDFARVYAEPWGLSLTVLIARDAFAARVIVPREAAVRSPAPPWNAAALAALGSTPLAMPIVACATYATPAEVGALRKGDAFVPLPKWPLTRGSDGVATGPIMLATPSFDLGLPAHLGEDGRIVLRGGLEPLLAAEAHMASEEKDAVVAALADVPVVVRVEIGEAVMSARDWASIGRGDVISLGRRAGEAVLLRVGGVPLARGELVELDGEVAVRILERLIGDRTTP
jgi:flagellar motor switch/type III secretory pathway protein FliN